MLTIKPSEVPDHLGGHMNKTHVDSGSLSYMKTVLDCSSILDVGCGPGGQVREASELGYTSSCGVDGDWSVLPENDTKQNSIFYLHDFVKGPWLPFDLPYIPDYFDLGWSVEFLEHVEERYMSHYMETFQLCNYLIVTHAVPGQAGHHHVNCQSVDYWIDAFDEFGFDYKSHLTQEIRNASTMVKPFIQRTGLVFKNSGRRQ